MRSRPPRHLAHLAILSLLVGGAGVALTDTPSASASDPRAATPEFTRIDIDRDVQGASFTAVGEVFPGEQNIVTSGYGELVGGAPAGGGTVQVYRPGDDLSTWSKVPVVAPDDNIVFPNRVTIADVNEDGLNDLILPGGWFFEPTGDSPRPQGTLTWWENQGVDATGAARPFLRHDITPSQRASFHGVDYVDLDGDGIRDLVTTSEAGGAAHLQDDDTVTLQYFPGRPGHTFGAARTLASGSGGSHPVAHDIDGDGLLDIVSAQYFGIENSQTDKASFMWFERISDAAGPLGEDDFEKHTIATMGEAGHGFGILPVPDLRGPGTLSWVGVNHQNRCFMEMIGRTGQFPAEAVMELSPGPDVRAPWARTVLSTPATPSPDPMDCDDAFRDGNGLVSPGDEITARPSPGQAAPGVFGFGDVDGDGDTDLVVSGDGDRRLFWIERVDESTTQLHTLTAPGETFGQAGGAAVADLNGDGTNELVFSSFDENTLALWTTRPWEQPSPTPPAQKKATTTNRTTAKFKARKRIATIRVKVTSTDKRRAKVTGKVRVVVKRGKKTVRTATPKLNKNGVVTIKVKRKKLRKKGLYKVTSTYRGSQNHTRSTGKAQFRVKKKG